MAARPTSVPVWNTAGTNRVTPSGGLQAAGYATGATPVSGNFNWFKNLVYQWILYWKELPVNAYPSTGFDGATPGWVMDTQGSAKTSTNAAGLLVPVNIPVGVDFASMRFRVKPNGATNTVLCYVYHMTDGAITATVGPTASTGGVVWENVTITTPIKRNTVNEVILIAVLAGGGGAGERRFGLVEAIQ